MLNAIADGKGLLAINPNYYPVAFDRPIDPSLVRDLTSVDAPAPARRRYLNHIKRDGRYLCGQQNPPYSGWISWNDALKRDKLSDSCCPGCLEVFYKRLNRTITVR